MHVVLFDIDGTLINTRGAGLQALRLAFSDVFGKPAPEHIDTCGRTDRGIARQLFHAHTLDDSVENWTRFNDAYHRHLQDQLPRGEGVILPGVVALLETLGSRTNVAVGLLTGNTPQGAQIKLNHFGIYHHFAFGGYGSEFPERNDVALEALQAAQQRLSQPLTPDRVWVIGDTPLDVSCARHIGARAIAVATGLHDHASLAQTTPDLLLDNLEQADRFLLLLDEGAE